MAIIETLKDLGEATTPELMDSVGLSERGTQGILKRLVEEDIVIRIGAGKNMRYMLPF